MRRDDPRERHAFLKLGELQLVTNDVIPLITSYPTDTDLVYNARESHGPAAACGRLPQQQAGVKATSAAAASDSRSQVWQQQAALNCNSKQQQQQHGDHPCSSNGKEAGGEHQQQEQRQQLPAGLELGLGR
jgi:hypothetical protein